MFQMWCCRFSIAAAHVLFLWLLFSIPNSSLQSSEEGLHTGAALGLGLVVTLALASFLAVQASDPGYFTTGAWWVSAPGA